MARNRRRTRPERTRSWKLPVAALRRSAMALGIAAGLAVAAWAGAALLDRPIRVVKVSGSFERVTPVQVEAALGDIAGMSFLDVDLEVLRERVEALEWVDDAVVRRHWPGELRVAVTEQVPAARWRQDGLLNTRGELFLTGARHIPVELPALAGPEGTEQQVARRYLEMKGPLAQTGRILTAVKLDARGAWDITLDGELEVRFGRNDLDGRFRRFIEVVTPILVAANRPAEHVDLRYGRGFAVAWSSPAGTENVRAKDTNKDV